ncbi:aminoglycoside phosphotransferase family protein [Glycomyces harbinensis]|uniref:Streptomycin 6-kinase n=1 Tax=Glycomyces harbinensis TaxID=58114 RepID=A0A1G6RIN4_9ACTN|nr:aminoglycoside phosphotransferase family protein [Glycomyces harbinensis]SDD04263.1 streptomycin 6-kinase [Glycomyces harbinensis]
MHSLNTELPEMVRAKANGIGDAGTRWLTDLPELIADLEHEWSIEVGPANQEATEAFVAEVRTADGRGAVLKLTIPMPWRTGQLSAIERAEGRGYVRLLKSDRDRHAMLLERLGPTLSDSGLEPDQLITTLCDTLREAWTLPLEADLTTGSEKALHMAEWVPRVWRELDRPCPAAVVDRFLRFADSRARAHRDDVAVHLHGDPHPGNALRVPEPRPGAASGFVLIDPDGLAAEPAYDLGVILAGWDNRSAGRQYLLGGHDALPVARKLCALLADGSGADPRAVWEWGYLTRVATGVFALQHRAAWGHDKLAVAARLL